MEEVVSLQLVEEPLGAVRFEVGPSKVVVKLVLALEAVVKESLVALFLLGFPHSS